MKKLILLTFSFFLFACSSNSNDNVMTSSNELQTKVLREGQGDPVKEGDNVSVHYTGKLTDGTVFDSSRPRGVPFHFTVGGGQVIEGWDKGVLGMKVGETRELVIPPALGYGDNDFGPIPGKSTLVFEVELLEIK